MVILNRNTNSFLMKNARISALLPASLVSELRRASEEQNITQSMIVKTALEDWFSKRLDADTKFLSEMSFDDLPAEEDWSAIQAEID